LTLQRKQDFIWGLGARFSSGNTTVILPTVVFTPNQFTDKLYSAFVQDEIPIVENRLSLTIGSKFMHNNYSGFEIQPSARLLWTPSAQHSMWWSVTRAVRTPSRFEEDLQVTGLFTPNPPTFFRLAGEDRKSTRLNSSHGSISYAVFCLKKKRPLAQVMVDAEDRLLVEGDDQGAVERLR